MLKISIKSMVSGGESSQLRTGLAVIRPDIRVIFEKNSEPAALNLKKALQRRHF
jgi:hypothetical protein